MALAAGAGVSDRLDGLPLSTVRGSGDRRRPQSAAPGLISYVQHSPTKWRQPRLTVFHELLALCRRTPCPSGSGRGAGPVLRARWRRGPDPAPPRICLEIPIASRQGERREATIRTRAHEAEIPDILIMPNWPGVMSSVCTKPAAMGRGSRRFPCHCRASSTGCRNAGSVSEYT